MSIFHDVLKAASVAASENPGDYRDANGILYCGVCGQPKEMAAPPELADILPMVTIQCKCQQEALALAEAERAKLKRRMLADESMRILEEMGAMVFPADTFAMDDGCDAETRRKAWAYAARFDELAKANLGIMFSGPVGSGKTFWASCIANKLISDGLMVMFTDLRRLVNATNDRSGENRKHILRNIRGCDLLILDDLGVERESSFMAEQVFQIIDERYQAKHPMVITSNVEPSYMVKATNPSESRIYQRILERCKIIQVSAAKRRSANAAKNDALWRTILEETEDEQ